VVTRGAWFPTVIARNRTTKSGSGAGTVRELTENAAFNGLAGLEHELQFSFGYQGSAHS
jgi:hypothetical protein